MKEKSKTEFERIKKIAKQAPVCSGIYQMMDSDNKIIYIGKAKNLKNRILQYFQESKHQNIKTKKMVEKIVDVKYIETTSELEALILETNLIKEHRPKYNILMRDDKNYVYIKVTVNEEYPKVSIVRKVENDGAKYFGPKTSGAKVEKMLNVLRKIFKYCTCKLEMSEKNGKLEVKGHGSIPCMDYHIKKCLGPCIGAITKDEYQETINQVVNFLNGKYQETLTHLTYKMMKMAENKKFETAASIRDQIKTIKEIFMPQMISEPDLFSRDVIGMYEEFNETYVNLFQFREGKLIDQENFKLNVPENDEKKGTESFLQFYYSEATNIPQEIFIRDEMENKEAMEFWLKEKSNHSVKIINPIIGKKNKILELSEKNAKSFARQSKVKWISDTEKTTGACNELAESLGVERELNRMECYDISHLAGVETVGSMVVFERGAPKNNHYRRFHIKNLKEGEVDDCASMYEILLRRLSKLENKEEDVKIRKATKEDRKEMEKIIKDNKLDNENIDSNSFYVIKENAKIIAMGRIKTIKEIKQVSTLWVDKKHRGKQLGYKIIKKLMEKNKLQKVYLICSDELSEYYEKFGFKRLKSVPKELMKQKHYCNKNNCLKPTYFVYVGKKSEIDESFASTPDLIMVDGGKGQLSAALKAAKETNIKKGKILFAALAKQQEELFVENKSSSIMLPRNSQALYLVQRIRDEAHRYANEFRKSGHAKKLVQSELDRIPGVGTIIKRRLLKEFGSIQAIKDAPMNELTKAVGEHIAKKLKNNL